MDAVIGGAHCQQLELKDFAGIPRQLTSSFKPTI
jgi:hypothetical protein